MTIFKEFDETWTKKIRAAKFCWFNAYWLNMMKNECDVPSIKPKYDTNNEINLYSYVHQAILMPEDGKHFICCFMFNLYQCTFLCLFCRFYV